MLGLFTPESSVWTWKTRPAWVMLWLKPLTARSNGLPIARDVVDGSSGPSRGARKRPESQDHGSGGASTHVDTYEGRFRLSTARLSPIASPSTDSSSVRPRSWVHSARNDSPPPASASAQRGASAL